MSEEPKIENDDTLRSDSTRELKIEGKLGGDLQRVKFDPVTGLPVGTDPVVLPKDLNKAIPIKGSELRAAKALADAQRERENK